MSKKGMVKPSDIESTITQIKSLLDPILSDTTSEIDLDIHFAEILSLLKTTTINFKYKLEALNLIISDLLHSSKFDIADTTFTNYSNKLNEMIDALEALLRRIKDIFSETSKNHISIQKQYKNRITAFEKDWKNYKKQIKDALKQIKKKIDTEFDNWVKDTRLEIEANISKIQKMTSDVQKKCKKINQLLERKAFSQAETLLKTSQQRIENEIQRQKEHLERIPADLNPLLHDLISKWRINLTSIEQKIPHLIHDTILYLQNEKIADNLNLFYTTNQQIMAKLDDLSATIEKKLVVVAEKKLTDIKSFISNFYHNQAKKLEEIPVSAYPQLKDAVWKWRMKVLNMKIENESRLNQIEKEYKKLAIEMQISELEAFGETATQKIVSLSELIAKNRFAKVEKEMNQLKIKAEQLFKDHQNQLTTFLNTPPKEPELKKLLATWQAKLGGIELEFQNSIQKLRNEYTEKHIPHLLEKLDLFIQQNIEFLNQLLDEYHTKVLNELESHFTNPSIQIHQILNDQKKIITQELKNKDEHIHLVFARYQDYPLTLKKKRWSELLEGVQERLNKLETKFLRLAEERERINQVLDKYYTLAQPAYGYKVPLSTLSEEMDIPLEQLEGIFVDLISNKIVSGEIDPVTKVIVLAPRVALKDQFRQQVASLRCMVCNLTINPAKEEIVYCPHCNAPAHRSHLIEWIKIKRTCPNCKRSIKLIG
ncbi:MAG: PCI domain-containing protein [Candidatus Helarchaeota archaeon]